MHPRGGRPRRVRHVLAALLVTLLALVSACSSGSAPGSEPSSTSSSSASSPSTGPQTLRLAVYGGPEELHAYQRLADAFVRRHPDVHVVLETAPDGRRSDRRLDREFAAGDGPDLFLTSSAALPSLVAAGRVQPVDDLLEERGMQFGDNYERLGLEAMADNAALQCMPTDVSPYVVFYNKRLMNTALLPSRTIRPPVPQRNGWSWNQFTVAAAQMSRGRVKGVYLPPRLTTLAPLMRSAGSDIVDNPKRPTTLTLSPPSNRADVEKILDVARNQTVSLTPRELARQSPVSRFVHGKLGMMVATRALVPRLRRNPELSFDVFPLPSLGRSSTLAEVSGLCISQDTEHQSAAADFIAFASSDRGAAIVTSSGGVVPANLNVLDSGAFTQTDRFPLNANVFTRAFRGASTMPDPLAWQDLVRQTQPLVNRLFYSQRTDLDELLPEIDRISAALLAEPTPSPSASPSQSPAPSAGPSGSATPGGPASQTAGDQPRDLVRGSRHSPTRSAKP